MTKLSPSHLAILASACDREDGIAVRPSELRMAAAVKAAARLVELSMVREVRTKNEMPTWCQTEQGHFVSLKILKAGREAVRASEERAAANEIDDGHAAGTGIDAARDYPAMSDANPLPSAPAGKPGSKRALVLALLSREQGATIDALIEATGWLPHTTRAALSVLRKSGITIERRAEDGCSVYRIDAAVVAAAA